MSGAWWVDKDELIDEQLKVLEIDLDKNLLILGPPGSGKTNLLLLRANHLHIADQPEFYIVTYTTLLAKFIRTGAHLYKFPHNKIITHMKLYETMLDDHGMSIPRIDGESFAIRTAKLRAGIGKLMEKGKGKHSFPMLFIDEAQDYDNFDLTAFFYLANNVCLSADARQGIYATTDENINWLEEKCGDPIRLKYHFRTGRKILKVADKIMDGKFDHAPMLETSNYIEEENPSEVDVKGELPLKQQVAHAAERLVAQLKAYPNQLLGVLVPRRNHELPEVWEMLQEYPALSGKITNTHKDFDPSLPIWVCSSHSAKGTEFRAVHLLAADTIAKFNAHARRLAFTAVTRAKTVLIVYHEKALLPFFASALAEKNTKKVGIDQIFGKLK